MQNSVVMCHNLTRTTGRYWNQLCRQRNEDNTSQVCEWSPGTHGMMSCNDVKRPIQSPGNGLGMLRENHRFLQVVPEVIYIYTHTYTHTLDKNGSLYDPAGTES